jgi:hypothetical protein
VTDWQPILLGVMAIALVVMAVVQTLVALVALKMARQTAQTLDEFRREIAPLIEKANRIREDVARVTSLAVVQMERVDRLMASTAERIDETIITVQRSLIAPARQGAAAFAAVRAALAAFRGWRERGPASRDDEEALFVG